MQHIGKGGGGVGAAADRGMSKSACRTVPKATDLIFAGFAR